MTESIASDFRKLSERDSGAYQMVCQGEAEIEEEALSLLKSTTDSWCVQTRRVTQLPLEERTAAFIT